MDLHTNDSSESAAGVFVSDKCQIPVGGIPQQEPDRQQYYMALCRQKVQEISEKLGRPLTCFISTFGCQMNAHDSEKLLGILLEAGFVEGTSEESDFVLYNTCTVRENANLRVYGRLGYLHSLKKKNPHMMIALCGCMMQEPEVVEKLKMYILPVQCNPQIHPPRLPASHKCYDSDTSKYNHPQIPARTEIPEIHTR